MSASAVHSLSLDTSLVFLDHYCTRLTRSKLDCTYAEHQPHPTFTCTLSIALQSSDPSLATSTLPAPPELLSVTSATSSQKKQAKAAAALLLCHQLMELGEFEPFAVAGQPGKFAFSSKREKRFQAARNTQPPQLHDSAAHAEHNNRQVMPLPAQAKQPIAASPPSASTSARPRDSMVLLRGLDAEARVTASDVARSLSVALAVPPSVHPFQSAAHPHFSAYLLHFATPAEAEEAVAVLDGRGDIVEGQLLAVHMLDNPHEVMLERAWYTAPPQLEHDWLRAEEWDEEAAGYLYFYAYRCAVFDDTAAASSASSSLMLLCPAALPPTHPLTLFPPLAPSLTADEYADQQPRPYAVRYAGGCRLSETELGVAQTWWARMAKDLAKRGNGRWSQEQRRYLILPILPDANKTTGRAQSPASDAALISSFTPPHNSGSSAHVTPDWELINQSLSDTPAVLSHNHFDADRSTLSSVILTTPHNGVAYLPHRLSPFLTARSPFPHPEKASGDHSFAAYFSQHGGEVDPASPLVEAQHLPSFAIDLTRPQLPSSSTVAVILAPQLCRVHPVPVQLWRRLRCVSSFMYALESQLLVHSLLAACDAAPISPSLLQAALTSRAVTMDWAGNYERLEFLGDSFIKHSVSSQLFATQPAHSAEQLTRLRVAAICNRNLAAVGQRALLPAIRADPFQPGRMSLAGVASVDRGQLSTGVVADVVEATVGAYYVEQGEEGARRVAQWLGLPAYEHSGDSAMFIPLPLSRLEASHPAVQDCLASSVPHLEHMLSYEFREPLHLLHALTHTSALLSFSYERLEWLGDAVLDWLVTRSVFASSPHRSPGDMTARRRSMVNRDAYAVLAVQLGLHDHMLAGQQVAAMAHDGAAAVLGRWGAGGGGYEAGGESLMSFKVLCDLLESVMGAVYVDSGMDVAAVKRVWDGMVAVEETNTGMRLVARSRERHAFESTPHYASLRC